MLFIASAMMPGRIDAKQIAPRSNLCAEIKSLPPGGELVLQPGDYTGGCTVFRSGSPERPIVIRAQDLQRRPRIIYNEEKSNALNIRASNVIIRGLEFGPTRPNVDGIRIYGGSHIAVEECKFSEIGGIAVVANHASVRRIVVRRNIILKSNATAMYFGCHNGLSCRVSGLLVERNYIHGVEAPDGSIGYGIQVKLNSTAILRDNVIVDTKGPGIMIYGAQEIGAVNVVERNFISGSRSSSGIVIGGGPAVVRNNISISTAEAGIGLENYGRRGLLRGIAIVHNTVYDNGRAGILAAERALLNVAIINNAVHARAETRALPPEQPGIRSWGNVDCSVGSCFADPDARNFSPVPGSLLFLETKRLQGYELPSDDFFGKRRRIPPTVGAVDNNDTPVEIGLKP